MSNNKSNNKNLIRNKLNKNKYKLINQLFKINILQL